LACLQTSSRPWAGLLEECGGCAAACLSWNALQQLVTRLNKAQGEEIYRLPTEVEWEYACRAGSTAPWFFGSDARQLPRYAWVSAGAGQNQEQPQPVGVKAPNPWGIFDIYGNVREWCQEGPRPYADAGFVGPVAPLPGDFRIVRGGSFHDSARYARSAARAWIVPSTCYSILQGGRLVREAPGRPIRPER